MEPAQVKSSQIYKASCTYLALATDFAAGRFYAGGSDREIHVFDLQSEKPEPIAKWAGHANYVSALALIPGVPMPVGEPPTADEKSGDDGEPESKPAESKATESKEAAPEVSSGAAPLQLVSGSYDGTLRWWNAAGGCDREVAAHDGWVRDLAAAPDGAWLASCGDDMLVKLWSPTGELVRTLQGHEPRTPQGHVTALYALAVSADGKLLASGDRVGAVRVWDVATGAVLQRFDVPVLYTYDGRQRKRSIGGIRSLAFSPDGERLAIGGIGQISNVDGLAGPATVEIWNWREPARRARLDGDGHQAMISQLVFESDWLIGGGGGSDNGLLAFWPADAQDAPAEGGKEPKPLSPTHKVKFDGHIHRAQLDPERQRLFAAGFNKVEVWSLQEKA